MKVLVIGGGGREHAIAWRLSQSPSVREVISAPGNPGTAQLGKRFPAAGPAEWLALAEAERVDLTVVGPEAPLVDGVVDLFRSNNHPVVGPIAAAAQLEASKAFSKSLMIQAGIPTARYVEATTTLQAIDAVSSFAFPVVLKADGLAAGKGVIIAQNRAEAEQAIPSLMGGQRLIVEEFLPGTEVSFIALTDGTRILPLQPSQDHKRVGDGDTGPNTGGMGAYTHAGILTAAETGIVMDRVMEPAVARMKQQGVPFTGFLYAGLMMTPDGPKVLEFNVRLGDPETQALLHAMTGDFGQVLRTCAAGDLSGQQFTWSAEPSVCVVTAAAGYPGKVRSGDTITGIPAAESTGATVFHAGTKSTPAGDVVTSGGRVLGVTASGETLRSAIANAYRAVAEIAFEGMHFRRDIGQKGLAHLE